MTYLDLQKEKNAVDLVTASMFSLDFLQGITNVIFSPMREKFTVGQFYDQWLEQSEAKEHKIPFSLGAIAGCLYCGLMLAKEHWYDLLPDDAIATANQSWGISGVSCISPKNADPSIKYVVKRIRNAIGHGRFNFNVPEGLLDRSKLMTSVTTEFHDINNRDSSDTFDLMLTLDQLSKLIKKFHSIVHQHVRSKA